MAGALTALRALIIASILIVLYYRLPLDGTPDLSTIAGLAFGLLVFFGLVAWQLRAILQSTHPAARAFEGLIVALPLFILVFAIAYYSMGQEASSNFSEPLSRTDALYFTVTIFATVGFGDISAQSEPARLVVIAQMLLDLVILGAGIRIMVGAVERARARSRPEDGDDLPSE